MNVPRWNLNRMEQGPSPADVSVPGPSPFPTPSFQPEDPVRIDRYCALPYALFQEAIDTISGYVGVTLTHAQAVAFLARHDLATNILYFGEIETQLRDRLCEKFVKDLFAGTRAPDFSDPTIRDQAKARAIEQGYTPR
jgi:hypothetical protein